MRLIDADALIRKFKTASPMTIDGRAKQLVEDMPTIEPEEVVPHNNLGVRTFHSDFWCTCGWYLGKKGVVRYCPNCGKKVKWRNSR